MLENSLLMPPNCRRVANPKAWQNQLVATRTRQPSRSCLRAASSTAALARSRAASARGSSQAAHRAKTVAGDGDGDAIAQLDLVALNRTGPALQRRRGTANTEKGDPVEEE